MSTEHRADPKNVGLWLHVDENTAAEKTVVYFNVVFLTEFSRRKIVVFLVEVLRINLIKVCSDIIETNERGEATAKLVTEELVDEFEK